MCLVCHVIKQDHVTKGLSNFTGGSLLRWGTILPSPVAIGIVLLDV